MQKLYEHVPFPALLDLSPFTCAPGKPAAHYEQIDHAGGGGGGGAGAGAMRLYAVIEHQGTFSGGHYVAFVRLEGR